MNIPSQISYNYSNKNSYLKTQKKHIAFKHNYLAKISETKSGEDKFASVLKKGVLALMSMLTVANATAKGNANSDIDINSEKVQQLGLIKEQIIELDKLDGNEDNKISKGIFAIAEAYKNGNLKIGTRLRAELLMRMNPQERAAFDLLTKPRIVKNSNGNIISETVDIDCDGKIDYIQKYEYDKNNQLVDITIEYKNKQ